MRPLRPLRPLLRCRMRTCWLYSETSLHHYANIFVGETAIRMLVLAFGSLTKCRGAGAESAGMKSFLDDEVAVAFFDSWHLPVR